MPSSPRHKVPVQGQILGHLREDTATFHPLFTTSEIEQNVFEL